MSVPEPMAIGSAIVKSPAPVRVKLKVPDSALPEVTSKLKESALLVMVEAAPRVIKPANVLLPLVLRIAPALPTPTPLTVMASATAMSSCSVKVAPEEIVVAPVSVPKALSLEMVKVPALTSVSPL